MLVPWRKFCPGSTENASSGASTPLSQVKNGAYVTLISSAIQLSVFLGPFSWGNVSVSSSSSLLPLKMSAGENRPLNNFFLPGILPTTVT